MFYDQEIKSDALLGLDSHVPWTDAIYLDTLRYCDVCLQ